MSSKRAGIIALIVFALVGAGLGVFAFQKQHQAPPKATDGGSVPVYTYAPDKRVRLVVYGDSVSQGNAQSFATGDFGDTSWPFYLKGSDVKFVGGDARGGLITGDVLKEQIGSDIKTDAVLFELGTNDRRRQVLHTDFVKNIEAIVKKRGYKPEQVVLMTPGPMPGDEVASAAEWNAETEAAAKAHGWKLIDPWSRLRGADGTYSDPNLFRDAIHPNSKGTKILAGNIVKELERVGFRPKK